MKQEKWSHWIKSIAWVLVGNAIYALTVKLFVMPVDLLTGGTTGIALALNYTWNVPVPTVVLVFNVLMLLLGWAVMGGAFALTTVLSTFVYPLFLQIFEILLGDLVLTADLMLCTLFTGVGVGFSLGLVIRSGASTGGMDIPPLVLQKLFRVPVSMSLYAFDVCILLGQAMFRPAENVLYGIVLVVIYTMVLDKMLLIGSTRTEIKIVSKKHEEICEAILEQVDRGVTLLEAETGFLRQETQLVLSVVSNREVPKVEKIIREIDPESFMIISRVSQVRGRGFSMNKYYRKKEKS